ncbi:MAG: ribonuclease Z [Candidatus Hydrogenedentota bacterium]|nr:MAG: ribonuclease Z [Candidatus Hydrogenedentota bacterium]
MQQVPVITIVGCGTNIPCPDRYCSGFHLAVGGEEWLIDCGSGVFGRFPRYNLDPFSLDRIFLTHHHPDHSADLVAVLFASTYLDPPRARPIEILGGPGTRDFVERLRNLWREWVAVPAGVTVTECETGRLERGGRTIRIFPMAHHTSSVAFRIDLGSGGEIVFTGDTGGGAEVVAAASGARVLVTEAAVPSGAGIEGHQDPETAARAAAQADVETLVLVHRYPEVSVEAACEGARSHFRGQIVVAAEGDRLFLEPEKVRVEGENG